MRDNRGGLLGSALMGRGRSFGPWRGAGPWRSHDERQVPEKPGWRGLDYPLLLMASHQVGHGALPANEAIGAPVASSRTTAPHG